jgi:hypothetical protein
MLGRTRAACAHQLTVQGHREENEAPQRLEQPAGEFLDVGQSAPLRGSTLRRGRGNLSNRAMAIDMCTKGNWAELRRTRQSGRKISVSESVARSTGAEARSGEEIGGTTTDFTARSDITTGRSRSMRPHTTCSPSGIFCGLRQKASLTNRLNRSGGSKLARGSALTVRPTVCSPGVPARSSNSVTS